MVVCHDHTGHLRDFRSRPSDDARDAHRAVENLARHRRRDDGFGGGLFDSPARCSTARRRLSFRAGVARIHPSARPTESPVALAFFSWGPFRRLRAPLLRFSRFRLDLRLALGILEQLGAREVALYVSHVPAVEDLRNARARIPRLYSFCPGVLRDVRYRSLARSLAEEGEVKFRAVFSVAVVLLVAAMCAPQAQATGVTLPPQAMQAL